MSEVAGLELFPAVDVAGGRAVGLVQAQYSSASTYGDPTEIALGWQAQGAPRPHGDRLAVCLDVEGDRLSPRGGASRLGDVWDALDRLEELGCARYIVTDVTRDGAMTGPNVDLLRRVCSRTARPVIASGGVSSLDDIVALRALVPEGLEGTIVGKALYREAFTLDQALDRSRS